MDNNRETNKTSTNHRLDIINRAKGTITGIKEVESFDEETISLDTAEGRLCIKGSGLHINRLTLEKGEIDIEGTITGILYLTGSKADKKNSSMFSRMFK